MSIGLTFANAGSSVPAGRFVPTAGTPAGQGARVTVVAVGEAASGERGGPAGERPRRRLHPNLLLYLGDVFADGTPTEYANWYGGSTALWGRLS